MTGTKSDPTLDLNERKQSLNELNQTYNGTFFLQDKNHQPTEIMGYIILGGYHVVAVIVLLNILIAMLNSTYVEIQRNSDVEWKFSKSLFFLEYNSDVKLFPVPFNLLNVVGWQKLFTSGCCSNSQSSKNPEALELNPNHDDKTFTNLMETLHRRYMNKRHEKHVHDFRKVTPEVLVGLFDEVLRGISEKKIKLQPAILRGRPQSGKINMAI